MLTVYGIKSCDTCRKARKYLAENDIEFRFHDVRDDGLDIQMLERWSVRIEWQKLLNRQSLTWRKIPEVDREGMTKNRAFALMLDQPTLVKRTDARSANACETPRARVARVHGRRVLRKTLRRVPGQDKELAVSQYGP
jgi:arsenate reductase